MLYSFTIRCNTFRLQQKIHTATNFPIPTLFYKQQEDTISWATMIGGNVIHGYKKDDLKI